MKPTMSSLALLPHCRWWARTEVTWPKERESAAAASGKKIHALAEAFIEQRDIVVRVDEDEKKKWTHLRNWIHDSRRDTWAAEVPLAWNFKTDTARFLTKTGKARDYREIQEDEIAGTADVIDTATGDVIDWKTGAERDESAQIQALVHAASKALGCDGGQGRAVYASTGGVQARTYARPESLDEARDLLSLIPHSQPVRGDHCTALYCKARKVCPAWQPGYREKPFSLIQLTPREPEKREMEFTIESGVQERPMKIVVTGGEGVGKSSFASRAPAPVFIGLDDGTKHLHVDRMKPAPQKWEDVYAALTWLRDKPHNFKTLVIDPVNWLEERLWDFICKRDGKANIEEYGFFKGQKFVATAEWRVFLRHIDELMAKRDMHAIMIFHPTVRKHKNPTGEDYDRFGVGIWEDGAAVFRQWADYVLYARKVEWTEQVGKGAFAKFKGKSDDRREMRTTLNAAYDAKSRPQLPDPLPLDWDAFMSARAAAAGRLDELKAQLAALLANESEETNAKAKAYISEDAASISRYEMTIAAIQERHATQNAATANAEE